MGGGPGFPPSGSVGGGVGVGVGVGVRRGRRAERPAGVEGAVAGDLAREARLHARAVEDRGPRRGDRLVRMQRPAQHGGRGHQRRGERGARREPVPARGQGGVVAVGLEVVEVEAVGGGVIVEERDTQVHVRQPVGEAERGRLAPALQVQVGQVVGAAVLADGPQAEIAFVGAPVLDRVVQPAVAQPAQVQRRHRLDPRVHRRGVVPAGRVGEAVGRARRPQRRAPPLVARAAGDPAAGQRGLEVLGPDRAPRVAQHRREHGDPGRGEVDRGRAVARERREPAVGVGRADADEVGEGVCAGPVGVSAIEVHGLVPRGDHEQRPGEIADRIRDRDRPRPLHAGVDDRRAPLRGVAEPRGHRRHSPSP